MFLENVEAIYIDKPLSSSGMSGLLRPVDRFISNAGLFTIYRLPEVHVTRYALGSGRRA